MANASSSNIPRWDWSGARAATVHCLVGCTIGEISGLVLGQQLGLSTAMTIALAIGLAFLFGFALASARIRRLGIPLRRAFRIAVAAETISITVMEVVNNGVLLAIPGALDANVADSLFWGALGFSLLVAFGVTLPVNAWLISRGRGHAVHTDSLSGHQLGMSTKDA